MINSNELELTATLSLGTLESNAKQIKELVLAKLNDYSPELYEGKAEEAKADRALLNGAEKKLNARRLELEREYMQPFNTFKALINDTCKAIKQASAKLDEIVKAEEDREKAGKLEQIRTYWSTSQFTLVPLEQVFDNRWLNKTTKIKDVYSVIDEIQKRIFDELKIIDNFPEEDRPLIKATYLETLDITSAMARAETLKANRARLAAEKKEREDIETRQQLKQQEREEVTDTAKSEPEVIPLVAAALDIEPVEVKETYACVFRGTRDKLLELRKVMTQLGITYTKLEPKGDGYKPEEKIA